MELEFELKQRNQKVMHASVMYDIERKGLNVGVIILDKNALPEQELYEITIK